MVQHELVANKSERVDQFLTRSLPQYSRGFLQNLIESGQIQRNSVPVKKKSEIVRERDYILVLVPEPEELPLLPEDLGIQVLYEDSDIMVVVKPSGMLTHPLHPGGTKTLVNAVMYLVSELGGINGVLRPGIVHRLDRETSGVVVIAKNDLAQRSLQSDFANRRVEKYYYAFVHGKVPSQKGRIDLPLGRDPKRRNLRRVDESENGRMATSLYQVCKSWNRFHLIRVQILTGRTHQIRVHLRSLGVPILGDSDYNGRLLPRYTERVMLHSYSLKIQHPRTGVTMRFVSPWPEDMKRLMQAFNSGEI